METIIGITEFLKACAVGGKDLHLQVEELKVMENYMNSALTNGHYRLLGRSQVVNAECTLFTTWI